MCLYGRVGAGILDWLYCSSAEILLAAPLRLRDCHGSSLHTRRFHVGVLVVLQDLLRRRRLLRLLGDEGTSKYQGQGPGRLPVTMKRAGTLPSPGPLRLGRVLRPRRLALVVAGYVPLDA